MNCLRWSSTSAGLIRPWGLAYFSVVAGEAVEAPSTKIMTKRYAVDRTKKDMPEPEPEPCKARKGSERKYDAEDVGLLINVLANRNCGCWARSTTSAASLQLRNHLDSMPLASLSTSGCCGIPTNPSDYVKKSQSNLEETLRRLINLQQHKLLGTSLFS
jgi:hypothetical protein